MDQMVTAAQLQLSTCRVKFGRFRGCLLRLLLLLVLWEFSSVLFLEEVYAPSLVRLAATVGRDAPG